MHKSSPQDDRYEQNGLSVRRISICLSGALIFMSICLLLVGLAVSIPAPARSTQEKEIVVTVEFPQPPAQEEETEPEEPPKKKEETEEIEIVNDIVTSRTLDISPIGEPVSTMTSRTLDISPIGEPVSTVTPRTEPTPTGPEPGDNTDLGGVQALTRRISIFYEGNRPKGEELLSHLEENHTEFRVDGPSPKSTQPESHDPGIILMEIKGTKLKVSRVSKDGKRIEIRSGDYREAEMWIGECLSELKKGPNDIGYHFPP